MIHLEMAPQVIRFREQPITTRLRVNGRACRYTPDIYAEQEDGLFVYEVKPEKDLAEYAELFDAAHQFFGEHGYNFVVVTDTQLKQEPLLTNRRLLLRYASHPIVGKAFDLGKAFLLASGGCSVSALAEAVRPHGGGLGMVYALIARGYVSAPIEEKLLTIHTLITWR